MCSANSGEHMCRYGRGGVCRCDGSGSVGEIDWRVPEHNGADMALSQSRLLGNLRAIRMSAGERVLASRACVPVAVLGISWYLAWSSRPSRGFHCWDSSTETRCRLPASVTFFSSWRGSSHLLAGSCCLTGGTQAAGSPSRSNSLPRLTVTDAGVPVSSCSVLLARATPLRSRSHTWIRRVLVLSVCFEWGARVWTGPASSRPDDGLERRARPPICADMGG